jgi:hypothetical protein
MTEPVERNDADGALHSGLPDATCGARGWRLLADPYELVMIALNLDL